MLRFHCAKSLSEILPLSVCPSNMSNQNKDDKVHNYIRLLFEDKNVLSKHSSEDVSTARNEFELLLEKTAHQTTTSLPPIKVEGCLFVASIYVN